MKLIGTGNDSTSSLREQITNMEEKAPLRVVNVENEIPRYISPRVQCLPLFSVCTLHCDHLVNSVAQEIFRYHALN